MEHSLCFLPLLVIKDLVEVDSPLTQELVHPDQGAVHHYEAELISLRVSLQEETGKLEGGFLSPDGIERLLCHRRGVLLLAQLDDSVGIIGAIFALRL